MNSNLARKVQTVDLDTSLDQIRQSQEADVSFARNFSVLDGPFPLEIRTRLCTDSWAVRHRLIHVDSGLSVPMSCGRYSCEFCGPRRVAVWRDVIELASPERFITLSRVGATLVEVGRVGTVLVRRLRRLGYKFEYLATFEQHKNRWFHIHMLQKGDYIPQTVLSDALRTATHGFSWVVDIRRCNGAAAGYVTKYVTKALALSEVGSRPDGTRARPNRVRYSRGFFGAPVASIRQYLRDQVEDSKRDAGEDLVELEGKWILQELAPLPRDFRGRVDRDAAEAQYRYLVEGRMAELGTEARAVRGQLVVLRYMLGQASDN